MKYQYRLIKEEEEESGLKSLRAQNELILTPLGQYTAEEFINILNDPKNLSGVHSTTNKKLEELETRVFGPTGRRVPDKEYIDIFNTTYDPNDPFSPTNGPALYKTISQEIRGFQPGQKKEIINNGKRVAVFPVRTAENLDIVSEFFTKRAGEPAKKPDISTPTVADNVLRFPIIDEKNLKKILNNANLDSGKDYKLGKQEVNEKLHAIVREEIIKFYKK
jgi:predicted RNA-binding protein with PUA-like domain